MAGFEELIRSTIARQSENGGASATAEQRADIYASSRSALERMVAQTPALAGAAAETQRERLEAAISNIEADLAGHDDVAEAAFVEDEPEPEPEFAEPVAPEVSEEPEPSQPEAPSEVQSEAPSVEAPVAAASAAAPPVFIDGHGRPPNPPPMPSSLSTPQRLEPSLDDDVSDNKDDDDTVSVDAAPERSAAYSGTALKKRRPFAKMLAWVIILAGIGTAGWWAWTFGPELLRQQIDGSVPNPEQTVDGGSFDPARDGGGEGWTVVFDAGTDAEALVAGARSTTEIVTAGRNQVARLTSAEPGEAGNILVRLPRDAMNGAAGQAATFEMLLKSAEGDQQFAVFCQFGALGECGRKRFATSSQQEAYIFDILLENSPLAEGEDAFLAINTDMGGTGQPVDLRSVRVRFGE